MEIKGNKIYVEVKGEKREVGRISDDNRRFVTTRTKEHFMKMFQGFGINDEVLDYLVEKVETIIIIYKRTDGGEEVFKTTPQNWKDKGISGRFGGFEDQIFLNKKHFEWRR